MKEMQAQGITIVLCPKHERPFIFVGWMTRGPNGMTRSAEHITTIDQKSRLVLHVRITAVSKDREPFIQPC